MNKCGLYSVHSWDFDLFQYLTILSLAVFSISKALSWNREVVTTQKRSLFMKASSFCFYSELVAMCVSVYICVYMCVSIYVYICTYVCRYVHRNSHTDDAYSQSLAFLPKTALKT